MSGRILELVSRIHLGWKRRITRDLAPFGVNPKQMFLLRKLAAGAGLGPSEIAELLFADRPTVTSMLSTLARAGWIHRGQDPADGRRAIVRISPAGQRKLAEVPERLWRSGRTDFDPEACLDPEEQVELRRLLEKVAAGLEGRAPC